MVPPATPVIVASTKIPITSNFFSIALKAPVIANATVPKRSKIYNKKIRTERNFGQQRQR